MSLLTEYWIVDLLITCVSFIFFVCLYTMRKFNYWKSKGIPFEKPIPLFGNFKEVALFRTTIFEYLASVYKRTKGPYCGIFAFDEPYLLIKDPELIKTVLVKDFNSFCDRAISSNEEQDPIGSYNLFIVKNPDWKQLRVQLSPMFSTTKVKLMFHLVNDVAQDLNKYIDNVIRNGLPSDAKSIAKKFTVDVISSCAFGIKSNCLFDENAQFWQAAQKISTFTYLRGIQYGAYFFAPVLVKVFRLKFFDMSSAYFLKKIFNESLELREKSNIVRNDLIDLLIELKKRDSTMKDDKLVAQAAIFFSAGFESSSSLIAYTLYELSFQPHLQTKLRNEILSVLKKNNGVFSYDCIQEMTYLDMVCSETLRKYPALAFLGRRCTRDYKLPGTDIILNKGISICIALLGLHYDPKYFPEPNKYDPERFSEENKRNIPFGVYMPFGEGPRNCVAARFGLISSKIALTNVLSNYEVQPNTETPITIKFEPKGFLLNTVGGLPLTFKKINKFNL